MQLLAKGQKVKISGAIELCFDSFYDVSCFCLNSNNQLIDDNHMVFYNQLANPDNSVKLNNDNGQQKFLVNLENISNKIEKMCFVITSDEKELKSLGKNFVCKTQDFTFDLQPSEIENEKALMFCEIYIKDGQWRYNAYAQGFKDGLAAVLKHFGGSEDAQPTTSNTTTNNSANNTINNAIDNNVTNSSKSSPVSLTKISLNKASAPTTISLSKDINNHGDIEVKVKWFDNGDGDSDNDDLDLRIGLLLPDGRMSLIHSDETGSFSNKPYIEHGGDVQVVQGSYGTEKVRVNPKISSLLGGKVALVFSVYSAVGNGAVSVASLKPIMEIKTKDHLITCEFNNSVNDDDDVYTYVMGMIIIDGDNLTVKQLSATSDGGSEETPWMTWNAGSLPDMKINGPSHFKGEAISKNVAKVGSWGSKVTYQYVEHRNI
jgi:tellurite resistance protein TerA